MAKKSIKLLSDKLTKVDEALHVYMYDNGYMVEVSGRDTNDEWSTAKLMCSNIEDVIELLKEASNMERS